MRKSEISASMMCSDLVNLKQTIHIFEEQKIEYLHIDVMDGEFVPNIGLGVDYIKSLRKLTSIPFRSPSNDKRARIQTFMDRNRKTDIVSVHYESTYQVQRMLDRLNLFGCKKFLAINRNAYMGIRGSVGLY